MSDSEIVLNPGAGGDSVAADLIAGRKHQRIKVQHGATGSATDVSTASPMPVQEGRTFAYASGTATGTVALSTGQFLKRVFVLAGATGATVTIGGGNTITIPPNTGWGEDIPGLADGSDVVIGGSVQFYYVAWVA